MNKGDCYNLADYVLSQDHEREDLIDRLIRDYRDEPFNRKDVRDVISSSIWAAACRVTYGKRETMKMTTEMIKEIKDEI